MAKPGKSKAKASPKQKAAEIKAEVASQKAAAKTKMELEETSTTVLTHRQRARTVEEEMAKIRRDRFPGITDYEYHIKVSMARHCTRQS